MTNDTHASRWESPFDPDGSLAAAGPDHAMLALADASHDRPDFQGHIRPYVIASTPRCGSTLLCHLLAASGVMGVPTEYFGENTVLPAVAARFGALEPDGSLALGRYLRQLARRRSSANGVLGIKLHFFQLEPRIREPELRGLLSAARYVWMRRRDRMAQAISFAIARRTGRFQEAAGAPAVTDDVAYSLRETLNAWRSVEMIDAGWQAYFESNAIAPLEVWYEDLVADPEWAFRRVCAFVGVADAPYPGADALPIRRQRSAVYDAWRAQLLRRLRIPERGAASRGG